jgi:uncharacterized membrane protein YeiH
MEHTSFVVVDLLGTLAFAVSGAVAARQRHLDPFGVFAVAYVAACGGGIIRDLCLGSLPPVGIADWRYVACVAVVSATTIFAQPLLDRLKHPIVFFDSLGLSFFAVVGAHKSLVMGNNVEVALFLGTITGVGGGVLRDVLLNRVPIILEKEIYALAALAGAAVQVVGQLNGYSIFITPWIAASVCLVLRSLALRYSWSLPRT